MPFMQKEQIPKYSEMGMSLALSRVRGEPGLGARARGRLRRGPVGAGRPVPRELTYAKALALENLGRYDESLPLWKKLGADRELSDEQRAYAIFFMARDALANEDFRKAYELAQDAYEILVRKNEDKPKIRECLSILMDVTERSGRYREAIKWADLYREQLPVDAPDRPALDYRIAGLYKKGGDYAKWPFHPQGPGRQERRHPLWPHGRLGPADGDPQPGLAGIRPPGAVLIALSPPGGRRVSALRALSLMGPFTPGRGCVYLIPAHKPQPEAHMDRRPIVAGQFYTAAPQALHDEVRGYMDAARQGGPAPDREPRRTLLAMAPHAGYVFSGAVAGKALGAASLAPTVLLLGPNHTGQGRPLAVWPDGRWLVPGGALDVDADLAAALMDAEPRLAADTTAHAGEHSLEVLVPFLLAARGVRAMVPVVVAEPRFEVLQAVAASVADVLRAREEGVSLVVSSDMSHYVSHERAKELDFMALDAVLTLDPRGLFEVVRREGITMCGVLPMALGLLVALELGASRAALAAYATSGEASGDFSRVVGYAGVLVD